MGYQPGQCVVIEDSEVGVSAALAAGIDVVRYDPDALALPVAGVVDIKSMADLPSALERIAC